MRGSDVVLGVVLGFVLGCSGATPAPPSNSSATGSVCPPAAATFGNERPTGAPGASQPTTLRDAPDPIVSDGDKYRVVLENDHVRVLRYHDKPGDKTHPHHHDEFVLYALSAFKRRLTFADGTAKERDFAIGDVIWMPEQVHTGENVGTTDTDVLIVENKLAPRAP